MAMNSSNFQILVNAVLDAKNIQAQLDKISQKYATMKVGIDVDATKLNDALSGLKGLKVGFDDTSTSAEKTSQSIGDIFTKVSKFGGVTLVINELRQSLMDGVDAVRELDAAVTEYKKVSDLTDEGMKQYIDTARELGLEVGKTSTEMIEASTNFKKMGRGDEESLQLAKLANMLRNVADEALSAGQAADFINAQMIAFNLTAQDAEHILDATNEVANRFAVSTGDLITAVPKVASTLSLAGNSMEQVYGLIVGAVEQMPGMASRVALGLRSVTLNLQKLGEDSSKASGYTANMEEAFNKLGITLMDENGQIKNTYDILKELAEVFPTLDKNTQTYYASLIGGKTQVN